MVGRFMEGRDAVVGGGESVKMWSQRETVGERKAMKRGQIPLHLTLLTAGRSIFLNQGSEDVPSQLKTLPGFHLLINKVLSLKKRR